MHFNGIVRWPKYLLDYATTAHIQLLEIVHIMHFDDAVKAAGSQMHLIAPAQQCYLKHHADRDGNLDFLSSHLIHAVERLFDDDYQINEQLHFVQVITYLFEKLI